jgi:hypothetical protein
MGITCQRAHYGDLSWGFKIFNVRKCACFHSITKMSHRHGRAGACRLLDSYAQAVELTARGNYAFKAASTRSGVNGM